MKSGRLRFLLAEQERGGHGQRAHCSERLTPPISDLRCECSGPRSWVRGSSQAAAPPRPSPPPPPPSRPAAGKPPSPTTEQRDLHL